MNLGNLLLSIRERKSLSQRALADLTGVSASYISLMERGKRQASREYLENFSAATGVPMYALFFLEAKQSGTVQLPDELGDLLESFVEQCLSGQLGLSR